MKTNRFLEQTKREYKPAQRFAALAVEAPVFMLLIPYALVKLGAVIDRWLDLPRLQLGAANWIIGVIIILAGWLLAVWSIYVQFTLGRGTPLPVMATQKLIIRPPYSYCRNPMTLGALTAYLGLTFLFGSIGVALAMLLMGALLLTYIKRGEEKEMEMRFGQEYRDYRARTPFLIPHFRNKG